MSNLILNVAKISGESMSWMSYLEKIDSLLSKGLSTGPKQTPELFGKSKLNRHRMQRIIKTGKVPVEYIRLFQQLSPEICFLIITEGWCGDAAQLLPYFELLSDAKTKEERIRFVLRDETTYIDNFLTDGSKSIPVIVAYNGSTGEVILSWGPRPKVISMWYKELKGKNTLNKDELSYQLHARYSTDKGKAFFEDMGVFISEILSKF